MPDTRERWRKQLPHWEVLDRAHFVTIRCAGSLPPEVRVRIGEIRDALQAVAPRSAEYAQLQRRYFLTCEKYLDTGGGFAPFIDHGISTLFRAVLQEMEAEHGWGAPHWVVMPNHVHLLLEATGAAVLPLRRAIPLLKGRFAHDANQRLHHRGPFWQTEWFDHWVRNEAELARIIDYIRQNPVRAGLARSWEQYPWVQ